MKHDENFVFTQSAIQYTESECNSTRSDNHEEYKQPGQKTRYVSNTARNRPVPNQECQPLLKAKYSPRAMPVQHFVNPGHLVQAVSCTQETMWPWPLTLIFNRLLEVVKEHVRAKFHHAKRSGSWVIMLTEKKLSNDAENNTAVGSLASNNACAAWNLEMYGTRTMPSQCTRYEPDAILQLQSALETVAVGWLSNYTVSQKNVILFIFAISLRDFIRFF